MTTTTGPAAAMPARSARATSTMSTKVTPTPRIRATTTSTRCPTWLTPAHDHATGPAAGTRPLLTATTSTMRTRAPPRRRRRPLRRALTPPAAWPRAATSQEGASCQLRRWPTTCTAWSSAACAVIDQRYTAGRRAIVDLLVSAGHPVSIEDIAERLPGLPRSSAYRHLTDLQAAGLIRRVTASDEYTRFELAEDLTEHHHHLLCINCGKVIDVTLPAASNSRQPAPSASSPTPTASRPTATASTCSASAPPAARSAAAAPANLRWVLRYPGCAFATRGRGGRSATARHAAVREAIWSQPRSVPCRRRTRCSAPIRPRSADSRHSLPPCSLTCPRPATVSPSCGCLDEPAPRAAAEVVQNLVAWRRPGAVATAHVLNSFDVVIVQHEYGIYGGADGQDVVPLLEALYVPVIVVLHTVLAHPTTRQRTILDGVVAAADAWSP